MSGINYSCADIGTHERVPCGNYKKGGISVLAFLERDHTITDFTNPSQWTTNINSGKVHLIGYQGFKAEYPDASPVETENPSACGAANILDAFDHTLNFMDANVVATNDAFWENVNVQLGGLAWYNCVDGTLSVVDKDCTWIVTPANSPYSNKERRRYQGKVTWTSEPNEFPDLYSAPAGIFT